MRSPNGFMLIELTVVMATSAALMGIATALIFLFMRSEETASENLRVTAVQARLVEQFRRDVHAARDAVAVPPQGGQPSSWRLELADAHTVVYQPGPGRLVRRETAGGMVVAEEIYRLPRYVGVSITRLKEGPIALVRLRIAPSAVPPDEPAVRPAVIDAALGVANGVGSGRWAVERRIRLKPHCPLPTVHCS